MKYLGKRLRSLFSVATVPAAIVAAISDFLSPIGGWLIALFLGSLATAVLLYWGWRSRPGQSGLSLERALSEDPELSWWFDGQGLLGKHAAHVLGVFAVFCLLVGFSSHARADKGGIAASVVPAVADLQASILDELKRNTAEQKHTTAAVIQLGAVVKRETSDNPRKELQNRGVAWTHQNFSEAIVNHDTATLDLFIAGGMHLESQGIEKFPVGYFSRIGDNSVANSTSMLQQMLRNDVYTFFLNFDPALIPSLVRAPAPSAQVCMAGDPQLRLLDALLDSKEKLDGYRQICASPEVLSRLKAERNVLVTKLRRRGDDILRCKNELRPSLKDAATTAFRGSGLASQFSMTGAGGADGALAYVLNFNYSMTQKNGKFFLVDKAGQPMAQEKALSDACDLATSPYDYGSASPDLKLFDKYIALLGSGGRRTQ